MRILWFRIRRRIAAHPRVWLASALSVAILAICGAALAFSVGQAAGTADPNNPSTAAHYDVRWSFRELEAHIQSGAVLSVTVRQAAPGQNTLLAKGSDGNTAAIDSSVSVGEAAAALVTLGYRDLLTPEAAAAIDARNLGS